MDEIANIDWTTRTFDQSLDTKAVLDRIAELKHDIDNYVESGDIHDVPKAELAAEMSFWIANLTENITKGYSKDVTSKLNTILQA